MVGLVAETVYTDTITVNYSNDETVADVFANVNPTFDTQNIQPNIEGFAYIDQAVLDYTIGSIPYEKINSGANPLGLTMSFKIENGDFDLFEFNDQYFFKNFDDGNLSTDRTEQTTADVYIDQPATITPLLKAETGDDYATTSSGTADIDIEISLLARQL